MLQKCHLITSVADSREASITPIEHKICLKIGALRAAELASPSIGYPNIFGNPASLLELRLQMTQIYMVAPIIVVMLPKGNTPWGGAT